MKIFTAKSSSEDMRPTAAAKRLIKKLDSTGGWKARQEILSDLGKVRLSFAATEAPEDRKEWLTVLDFINDGIKEAVLLRDTIKRHMK